MFEHFMNLGLIAPDKFYIVPTVLDLPSNAVEGMVRYVDADKNLYIFNGIVWALASGSGGGGSGVLVDLYDPISSTLPTGASATIDGITLANDMTVLFSGLITGTNQVYKASGVGTSITWIPMAAFTNSSLTPSSGESVRFRQGSMFYNQLAVFDGIEFNINAYVRYFDEVTKTDYWEQSSLKTAVLLNNVSDPVFSATVAQSENWVIDFSISRGTGNHETGQLYITSDGSNASVSTSSAYLGTTGITFSVLVQFGILTLVYTSANLGSDATMKYFTKRWANNPGGPGGVPSYTSAVSGVMAAGSAGDVQFKSSSGFLAGDSNLNWDTVNQELNIGGNRIGAISAPINILDNQVAEQLIFSYTSAYKFVTIEYSLERGTDAQLGEIMLVTNGTTVSITDDFVGTAGSLGVTFHAHVNGANIDVKYTSTSTGQNATFKYAQRRWS